MTTTGTRSRIDDAIRLLLVAVAVMWLVEIVDLVLGGRLDGLGIRPREAAGLIGVATAPFLHAGFGHLLANTVPLVMLGLVIAVGGAVRLVMVTAVVALASGLGVWMTAPASSVTIGASGLVFGYAGYLIARGVATRNLVHLGIGMAVLLFGGAALLAGLVPRAGVSWQAHLFGVLGGVLAARLLARPRHGPAIEPDRGV